MKNFFRSVFFLMLAFWGSLAKAQCPNDNTLFFTYAAPSTIGASVGSGICIFGGEYYVVTNMVAGNTYRLSSCGSTDIVDTRITVYPNAAGGSSVAFNDDFCGTRAQLDFTPTNTGSYRILLDQTGPGNTCTSTTSNFNCGEVVVTLISTGPTTAYCAPQYAVGTANGDYINGVTLGSISNLNTGSSTGSSFNNFTNISTALQANTQYTLQVQNNPDFAEIVAAWIDYNQDLTFTSDELLGQTSVSPGATGSINFTTPSNALLGNTRMRVRMTFTIPVSGGQMDPCTSYQFGEAEDYGVSFTADPPGPPSGLNFSTICGLTTAISDNACPNNTLSAVSVTGLGTALGTGQIISSVDVVIDHGRAADLDIFLEAPNGAIVELSTDNGGNGSNYGTFSIDSCDSFVRFTMSSSNTIATATAPFIGNYLPEGDLADLNDGSNPNGIWRLRVCDDQAGSTGTIRYFSVNFENVQSELPSCADSYNLEDAAVQVALNQQLTWVTGTGQPTGYDVYFGTSATPGLASEGQSGLSYDPGALLPLTTYYYQIVPSNSAGSAEGCPVRSFITTDNSNEIVMVNGSVNACSGTFADPGGVNGDYFSSDTLVFTIFPDSPNSAVQVTFNSFELENGFDLLLIVDGVDENGAVLGVYNGTNSPGIVTATNPDGALTFAFLSDEIITAPGWSATVDCVPLTGIPECANNLSPADGASGVLLTSELTWVAGSTNTTGYDVYFGTSSTPELVASGIAPNSFDPDLAFNTTYFYQIVPVNSNGSAEACPVLSFSTQIEQDSTIWDVVVNSPVHNTLETLVSLAGLDGALAGPGPLTLFAPTDAAFTNLPQSVVDALVADPTGALAQILLYHVVGSQPLSTDLSDGQQIVTLNGESVTVSITGGNVFINDAQVIVADILTDNGVVHVIDAVLVPPTPEPDTTVWDIVVNSNVHNTLESLVLLAELDGALDNIDASLTLFAPTDAAFAALDPAVVAALTADPTGALAQVLLYHVVGSQALSTDLSDGQQIVTLNGESVTVTISNGNVLINDAQVIVRDILADNGVVHVIDAVLVPATPEPDTTIWDIVVNSEVHNTLESLVLLAELDGALDNIDASLTLFAPTDAAFAALDPAVVAALTADPTGALAQVLLYHVVGSQALSTDLSDGQQVATLNGESVTVTINVDGIFINDAQVILRDILADNGVVHVIDAVLVPPTPEPDTTVWDIVVNSNVHNTLESLVLLAGLDGALDNIDASLTLFAPTDAAFAALNPALVDALVADPTGALAQVLLYHVVGSPALTTDLSDGQQIVTLNGESVTVSITPDGFFINDAQVIIRDILADNGVVHVIDAVLVPPTPEPAFTIWDVVVNSNVHNTLETLVELAGLDGALDDSTASLTLFAPTDAAFAALDPAVVAALTADPTGALAQVLLYHVVGSQALSTDLSDGQQIVTLNGESVTVSITGGNVFINDAQVIIADILADNGVVHVIDAVLVPPTPEPDTTVWDMVVNSNVHNTLESLVLLAELDGALDNIDASLTLFAPTDAAFAALDPAVVAALTADPTGALAQVLLYHVVGSQALSTDLSDGQQIVTLNGESVTVSITGGNVFINDAQVIIADILADNGVVHVIDAVLVPPTPEPDTTVWDIVVNSNVHNTLESLVLLAELDGALDNIDASLTLFAPTDAAFAALDPAVVAALTADPTGALAQVLLYHVVGSQALSTDLSDGQQIVTLNGESVTVSITGGNVFINDAQVIVADILADNGVVHVIDAVLVPPTPEPDTTVWDIVVNSNVHNTLESLVLLAELDGALDNIDASLTLFAPTDAAFAALDPAVVAALTADPTGALAQVLLYHVVGSQALSTDLSDGQQIVTLNGESVTVSITGGNVFINDAQVIIADILADNGVVHVIDAVLVPPTPEPADTILMQNGSVTTCDGVFYDAGGATADYELDENYTLTINPGDANSAVQVIFNSFNTEAEWDGMYVYDGPDVNSPLIASANPAGNAFGPLTQPGAYWGTTVPGPFTSSHPTGALTFVFLSDDFIVESGWDATITCVDVNALPGCAENLSPANASTDQSATNTTLSWSQGSGIVTGYDVYFGTDCNSMTLVSEGQTETTFTPTSLELNTSYAWMVVPTNANGAAEGCPCNTFTTSGSIDILQSTAVINACSGNYYDTGGPEGDYANNEVSELTICPDQPNSAVEVTFSAFDLEENTFTPTAPFDYLVIYNGTGTTGTSYISPTTGTNQFSGSANPGPFTSSATDGCLTFAFESDLSVPLSGWTASIGCVTTAEAPGCATNLAPVNASVDINAADAVLSWNPGTGVATGYDVFFGADCNNMTLVSDNQAGTTFNPGVLELNTSYAWMIVPSNSVGSAEGCPCNTFTTGSSLDILQSTAVINTCAGNYYDSGGLIGAYSNNEISELTICPDQPNSAVEVTFSAFDLEENTFTPTAPFDYLVIYNGTGTTGTSYISPTTGTNQFSGSVNPGPFTSTATDGCLTFSFESDFSVTLPGWTASIGCVTTTAAPGCATNLAPADAAVEINAGNAVLSWSSGTGIATGYDVFFGTDCNNMTLVSENQVGTTFNPGALELNSSYAWMIVPSNSVGSAEGCPCNTFTTGGTVDILMQNGTFTTCAANFFDSAGPLGNYLNNENYTITFQPNQPNSSVQLLFNAFNTEATWDGIYVYDGPDVNAPLIASANPAGNAFGPLTQPGAYWGTIIPGPFTSTHPTGALTIVFLSDASVVRAGWEATIACVNTDEVPACATITAGPADGATDVCTNEAVFSWQMGSGAPATGYDVYLSQDGSPFLLFSDNQSATTFDPGLLIANTNYSIVIVPTNANGDAVGCDTISFTTGTCLNYCDAGATTCDEFISNVSLGSINNETGCGLVGGYSDYTSQSADLYIGTASTVTVTNGSVEWPQDQCGVWIDWNQDGDFADANETITVTGIPGTGPYTAGIIPPADAVPGPTRMRVRITFTGLLDPCGTTGFGEVEDYTVVVNQPLACPFPNFVLISDITTTNAAAIWETVGTESQYLVRYRPQGSATTEATWANPIVVDAPATFTFLTDLEPCTNYVLQVASLCPGETDTTYSGDILFGTDCIVCEADFTAETEACGANENGGCLVTPQAYQPISCGETICGTTSVTSPTVLDLDWYSFTVDNTADYTFKVLSEFLGDVFVINIENCSPTVIPVIGSTQFLPNNLQTFTTTLAPGTYAVVVQPNPDQTPFDCSSIYNGYTLELTGGSALIAPVPPVCGTSEPISLFGIPAGGTWSGTGIVDGATGIFDPSAAGVGTFVITYEASGSGCPSVDTISIEVIDAPVVEFTGLAGSYCPSDDVVQLNGIPAGGSFSINSSGGAGIVGSSFNPSAVEPGNYEITYSVVSSGTCVSENVQSVVVNTAPSVNFSLIDNTCSGNDPVSMDATPTGGTFTGSGVFGSTFDPSLASIGENSVTYSVSLPGETCPGTATEIIVVNPSPIVSLSGLATTYCLSSAPVQLIGTPALGTFSGPGVSGSTFNPADAGVGTHTIVYQFDNGTCIGSNAVVVTVTDNIALSFNLPSSVCSNDDPFVLTSTPSGATFSGIGVFGQTFSPQAAGVGSHTITATYNTGTCFATVTQSITVNPSPVASFSYSANGANVSFSNGSVNASSYSWNFGDGQTSAAVNPSHTYTTNGSYTITLVASSASCGSDTFTVNIELSVGIGSIEGVDMIQLYPNPTEGNVNLSFNSLLAQSFEVRITDAVGRLIESENVNNYAGKYAKVYSLENLADGVYTFTVSSEKGAVNFRVVKN